MWVLCADSGVVSAAMLRRPLIPLATLLWGLQFALLSPALALILASLYGATPAEIGVVLAIYNASGFVASLIIPAWADRRGNYLLPLFGCGALTLALAAALAAAPRRRTPPRQRSSPSSSTRRSACRCCGPVMLLALQALNAGFFAALAGIGLTIFQDMIPRPGIATGLYTNTRRIGTILAGPIIGIASTPWGYPGLYAACAALTALAGAATWWAGRHS